MTNNLSENEISELACTYASLILHDDNIPVTVKKKYIFLKKIKCSKNRQKKLKLF